MLNRSESCIRENIDLEHSVFCVERFHEHRGSHRFTCIDAIATRRFYFAKKPCLNQNVNRWR